MGDRLLQGEVGVALVMSVHTVRPWVAGSQGPFTDWLHFDRCLPLSASLGSDS